MIDMTAFLATLPILAKGMAGIFIVMGKAEMPVAPTMGLIFLPSGRKRFSSLAKNTPPTSPR